MGLDAKRGAGRSFARCAGAQGMAQQGGSDHGQRLVLLLGFGLQQGSQVVLEDERD